MLFRSVAPIVSVRTKNPVNGKEIIVERTVKGAKEAIKQAIVSCKYGEFWLPASIVEESHNELVLTMNEVGDTFVATSNSSRKKKDVIPAKELAEMAKAQGVEVADLGDEQLYYEGDTVTRQSVSYVAQSTQVAKPQELSFEDKLALMAKYGLTPKL